MPRFTVKIEFALRVEAEDEASLKQSLMEDLEFDFAFQPPNKVRETVLIDWTIEEN